MDQTPTVTHTTDCNNGRYKDKMTEYRRLRAQGKFHEALRELDMAIDESPCDEALPTLEHYRHELLPLTSPAPLWKRMLGWQV